MRERAAHSKNLVGFRVGDVRYALDIFEVREILNPLRVVALPHAPEAIAGVADHRGGVVPVLDLRIRFGLARAEPTRRTKWIVVKSDAGPVAFVVDEVTGVFGAGPESRRPVPELGSGNDARGITNVYRHDGDLVFVLGIERVASPAYALDPAAMRELMAFASNEGKEHTG